MLTRTVVPTSLIAPTRPMILNSAIVLMIVVPVSKRLGASGPSGVFPSVLMKEPGQEPDLHPRLPPKGGSAGRSAAEDGGRRQFCFARNSPAGRRGKLLAGAVAGQVGLAKPLRTEEMHWHGRSFRGVPK